MNEDYSEPFDFTDAVNAIVWQSMSADLPMPSWIRDNTPGTNLLVLSWTTAEDMRAWFTYFRVRQHRADPPVWAWGWHGWTVLLSVLESGAGGLSVARPPVSVTDDLDALRRQGFDVGDPMSRGAALAAAFLAPDATIEMPAVTA